MPTLEELYAEAIKLDAEARSELARRLSESVRQSQEAAAAASENERERLWLQEAMRRSRELRERASEQPPLETSSAPSAVPAREARARKPLQRRRPRPKTRPKRRTKPSPKPRRPVRRPKPGPKGRARRR